MKIIVSQIHFEILKVSKYSTKGEIRQAYIQQIKIWHPDKFPNNSEQQNEALEKSKKINEAYSLLENYNAPIRNTPTGSDSKTHTQHTASNQKTKEKFESIPSIRVNSSNISSIGYDQTKLILQVTFLKGTIYHYYDVPIIIYNALMMNSSKGRYFNQFVANRYRYKQYK